MSDDNKDVKTFVDPNSGAAPQPGGIASSAVTGATVKDPEAVARAQSEAAAKQAEETATAQGEATKDAEADNAKATKKASSQK